jgi:hypothetical protein
MSKIAEDKSASGNPARHQRGYLLVYFAMFFSGLFFCVWASTLLVDYRKLPIRFDQLQANQRVVLNGLTREQIGDMKFGYLENANSPETGLFGNHQIQFWSRESLVKAGYTGTFFNYWFANLALPDILDYLRHVERVGRLPKKRMIVQITTPNNDNGQYIASRSKELPFDIQQLKSGKSAWAQTAVNIRLWLTKTFDYSTVLMGLFHSKKRSRVVALGSCANAAAPGWQRYIPSMLAQAIAISGGASIFCDPALLKGALRADGSASAAGLGTSPIFNQNALDPKRLALNPGDEKIITDTMKKIISLAERNSLQVLFLIPPVYEERRYSIANKIVDMALSHIPKKYLLDHRYTNFSKQNFINYDHPAALYFDHASKEIRDRLSAKK